MTGDPYVQRNRLHYGRTFVSAPPAPPKEQRITRIVSGVPILYIRLGNSIRIYDGTKRLPISAEAQRQIVDRWPHDDDTTDPIDWWG